MIAAGTFLLLTGLGAVAQVAKLVARERAWKHGSLERGEIYSGLLPIREWWSYTAFLLFALSGLTRPYIDYYLILSRLPVVLLTTVILFYLARHRAPGARICFRLAILGDLILAAVLAGVVAGWEPWLTMLPRVIDIGVGVVGVFLVYGKMKQAREMSRTGRSAAVSWFREGGLLVKDLTGLVYAYTVGLELLVIGVTHALSFVSSASICLVKWRLEWCARAGGSPPYGVR